MPHRKWRAAKGDPPVARMILIALVLYPILEIAVLIKVGQTIGLWPTLALVIGAAVLGGFLLRNEGLGAVRRLAGTFQRGQLPGRDIADMMMLGFAAVLLMLPGLITDVVALALLLPPVRHAIYGWLSRRVTVVDATTAYYRHETAPDPRLGNRGTIELDDDEFRPR